MTANVSFDGPVGQFEFYLFVGQDSSGVMQNLRAFGEGNACETDISGDYQIALFTLIQQCDVGGFRTNVSMDDCAVVCLDTAAVVAKEFYRNMILFCNADCLFDFVYIISVNEDIDGNSSPFVWNVMKTARFFSTLRFLLYFFIVFESVHLDI